MRKPLSSLAMICSLCIISGCSSGGSSPPPPVVATQFSVTPASPPTAGTPFNFTVTALGASGQTATSSLGPCISRALIPKRYCRPRRCYRT